MLLMEVEPAEAEVQKTLVARVQLPARTSITPANCGAKVMDCEVPLATNEYHTSLAVVLVQLVVGAVLCVAPNTVPLVGVVQVLVTGRGTAWAQLSLVAGLGLVVKEPTLEKLLLPVAPPQFCTM